jgi:hypothetical protein
MLSNKVGADEVKQMVDSKASMHEIQSEMHQMKLKFEDQFKDMNRQVIEKSLKLQILSTKSENDYQN